MSSEALKECPFCNAAAEMERDDNSDYPAFHTWNVACSQCDARGPEHKDKPEAIAAWNCRATPSPASGERASLVEPVAWRQRAEQLAESIYCDQSEVRSKTKLTDAWHSVQIINGEEIIAFAKDYAASQLAAVAAERDALAKIVQDIHWMAVRYADGRQSYAVGMCNDALRKAYDAGWLVYSEFRQHDLDPQYARDGSKPEYRHIEDRALTAERLLAGARAERDLLQEILDGRPAINAALPDSYVRWSQAIYAGDMTRSTLSPGGSNGQG